jgi:peroxiredoxin
MPGFIRKAAELKAKGVEAVYCLSVNDAWTMQAWGDTTAGCWDSGLQLIADGNGDATRALDLLCDCTAWRMGKVRCERFAAIIRDGEFTYLGVDKDGVQDSSVDAILAVL